MIAERALGSFLRFTAGPVRTSTYAFLVFSLVVFSGASKMEIRVPAKTGIGIVLVLPLVTSVI